MLFRAIALSLALLVGIGTIIPFITNTAEAGPKYSKTKKWKVKKYSKAWWRLYRKQQRKKRAILARKRALRAKQILLARQGQALIGSPTSEIKKEESIQSTVTDSQNTPKKNNKSVKSITPIQPQGFIPIQPELQFQVLDEKGITLGNVSLSIIGPAAIGVNYKNASDKIAGVPTRTLLVNAVEQILKEQGWIINDYQKDISNKRVYVVVGQSLVNEVIRLHHFYFTESGGKIYRIAASCPKESQERFAKESEKVIQSL